MRLDESGKALRIGKYGGNNGRGAAEHQTTRVYSTGQIAEA